MAFNQLLNRENEPTTATVIFYLGELNEDDKWIGFVVGVKPNYISYTVIHSQTEVKQVFLDLLVRARKREIFYLVGAYGESILSVDCQEKISNLIWRQDPL